MEEIMKDLKDKIRVYGKAAIVFGAGVVFGSGLFYFLN
jgi:5,10-methylene-tetrahydrofolate dehydrogenase/methenyl tetrahydrofolate cyclohydrolase